jgi:transposase-like protein
MSKVIPASSSSSSVGWDQLEEFARGQVQAFVQRLLDEEIDGLLGRRKSERREPGAEVVYRNGFGKPRRLALSSGTITVRRPRIRGLEERFESRVLPLFKRRTETVGELLPQLYLHGPALGDFELALRGLLGDAAPLRRRRSRGSRRSGRSSSRAGGGGRWRTSTSCAAGRMACTSRPVSTTARRRSWC